MKRGRVSMSIALLIASAPHAQTVSTGAVVVAAPVVWSASPAGAQPMPDAPSLTLLSMGGAAPLRTGIGGKCLLVARRGTQMVAVELSPVVKGRSIAGWTPHRIDSETLVSKWGYRVMQGSANIDMDRHGATQSAPSTAVAINGKTYRKVSQFKQASAAMPSNASDEYLCE